jgi:hypothetical protein
VSLTKREGFRVTQERNVDILSLNKLFDLIDKSEVNVRLGEEMKEEIAEVSDGLDEIEK